MYKPAHPGMAEDVPYTVVLIDLDEGVRMMSNVVGIDVEEVVIGQRVEVSWEPLSDGRHLPVFTPTKEG